MHDIKELWPENERLDPIDKRGGHSLMPTNNGDLIIFNLPKVLVKQAHIWSKQLANGLAAAVLTEEHGTFHQ